MDNNLIFKISKPGSSLSDFVESFWFLHNSSDTDKEIVVLPDGRVDLILSKSATETFHIALSGLETVPHQVWLAAKTQMCAISFKVSATEYLFPNIISGLLDYAEVLPPDFWGFEVPDLGNFENFQIKAAQKIQSLLPVEPDDRKLKLFHQIYSSKGSATVQQLSESVHWNSRQINRYFTQQFGLRFYQ